MIDRETFARYLRDALTNLYHPVRLRNHPLGHLLLAGNEPPETRAASLRQVLVDAIELMPPPDQIPFSRPEWMVYRVMKHRYVEALTPLQVCQEVGVGRSSFYRLHREGLLALAHLLWDRCSAQSLTPETDIDSPARERARAEAARFAPDDALDAAEILLEVEDLFAPVAAEAGTALSLIIEPSLPTIRANELILRQAVLSLLSESMALRSGDSVTLRAQSAGDGILLEFRGLRTPTANEVPLESRDGIAISQGLLDVLQATLTFDPDEAGGLTIRATIPGGSATTILIVEDDDKTTDLYRRFLRGRQYTIRAASNAQELEGALSEAVPDAVLLDVLMPTDDGWKILQDLKAGTTTRNIPVIVCSVLIQPGLALVLGAAAVLQKPIEQKVLLETLDRCLQRPRASA